MTAADGSIIIDSEVNGAGAEAGLSELQKKLEATGEKMQSIGKGMTAGVTAPIMAVGGMALKTAADFESANGKMQAQLGLTAAETEKYGDMAQDMWKNAFGENIGDVTGAIATVKQNISDLNDADLQKVTESAFILQDVFEEEIGASTATASVMMKNFGIDADGAMDLMTVGMQKGGNYTGELLDTMREYAPVFAAGGHSAEDMMNILISGAEAGAFNLDKVGDSMKEFGIRAKDGSDSSAEAFEALGLDAADMLAKMSAGGKAGEQAFQATIASLAAMEDPIAKNAAGVALFGGTWEDLESEVVTAMSNSVNHVEGFEGATQRAGDAAYDTFGSRLTTLWRTTQESLIPLGETMLAMAEKFIPPLMEAVTKLADWFSGLSSEFQLGVIVIGAVLAALGPFLVILGTVISSVAGMIPVFIKVWNVLTKLKVIFTVIRTAFLLLTGPVGIIIAIVTALAYIIYKNWDAIKEKTAAVFGWLGEFLPVLWEKIKAGVSAFLSFMASVFMAGLTFVVDLFKTIWGGLVTAAQFIWEGIILIVTTYINMVKTVISTVLNAIVTVFTTIWNAIVFVVQTAITTVQTVITTVLTAAKTVITTTLTAIQTGFTVAWNAIKNAVSAAVNFIHTTAVNGFNLIKNFIVNTMSAIQSRLLSIWQSIRSAIATAVNAIRSAVANAFTLMKNAISSAMTTIRNTVKSAFDKVLSFVTGLGTSFYNAGKGLIEQIIKGIKAMIGKVTGTVKDVAKKIRDFLPFSPAKEGPLSDLDHLDFGGPIQDSLKNALPKVRATMQHLLQVPQIKEPAAAFGSIGAGTASAAKTTRYGDTVNHFNIQTQPGQEIDHRRLSQELYKLQARDKKGAGRK